MATRVKATKLGNPDVPRGMDLPNRQALNKGTAFTEEERNNFGLDGLLPPPAESMEAQVVRTYQAYKRNDDDLAPKTTEDEFRQRVAAAQWTAA